MDRTLGETSFDEIYEVDHLRQKRMDEVLASTSFTDLYQINHRWPPKSAGRRQNPREGVQDRRITKKPHRRLSQSSLTSEGTARHRAMEFLFSSTATSAEKDFVLSMVTGSRPKYPEPAVVDDIEQRDESSSLQSRARGHRTGSVSSCYTSQSPAESSVTAQSELDDDNLNLLEHSFEFLLPRSPFGLGNFVNDILKGRGELTQSACQRIVNPSSVGGHSCTHRTCTVKKDADFNLGFGWGLGSF